MFVGMGANSAGGYNLESSLRLRGDAGAYLSRTLTANSTSSTTMTFSWWHKWGASQPQYVYTSNTTDPKWFRIGLSGSDSTLFVWYRDSSSVQQMDIETNAVFRDPSAWYHFTIVIDTTQATASNRVKLYVNGEQITSFSSATYPSQNYTFQGVITTSGNAVNIGRSFVNSTVLHPFEGYITEYHHIDGQALTPSDFGEYDDTTGVWKPKQYTGTYGTNGFYLPMKETQQATGFNTVLFDAQNSSQSITGVGFSPDFVWLRNRQAANNNYLLDSVRGSTKLLYSDSTSAEGTASSFVTSLDSDGFTINSNGVYTAGNDIVAWCWDAGSSTVSNTDGTITSSVRANPDYGFSVVTYTGNTTAGATVGHGLGSAPDMIIIKDRDTVDNWAVYHSSLGGGNASLFLEATTAVNTSLNMWNSTAPSSSVITLGDRDEVNRATAHVAYCFSEVAGFSKFGSYTGTGASGNSVTGLGFRPAFLMIKSVSTGNWYFLDNTRSPDNSAGEYLLVNTTNAEAVATIVDFDNDGFTVNATGSGTNGSGTTYIYMAFADTRDAQFNFDASGNKNNWTANNINSNASSETTYDIMNDVATLTDEDTANFATWNPLDSAVNYNTSNGNLSANTATAYATHKLIRTTHGITSGKYYWELNVNNSANIDIVGLSPINYNGTRDTFVGGHSDSAGWGYNTSSGAFYNGGNWTTSGTASGFPASGIVGVAFDADNGKLYFSKNGVWFNSADPSAGTGATHTYTGSETGFVPALSMYSNTGSWTINFGQRPFAYTPPTGYKKLNTYNLPDSTIADGSQYFDAVTYTGNGTAVASGGNSITSLEFQPDFVWIKDRTSPYHHNLSDVIRGPSTRLYSSLTNAEDTNTESVNSFDSNGFTVGNNVGVNTSSNAYVAWNWKANGSGVSNTDGTITSTVSANTTSGFSVVTYTGNATAGATIGHGLGVAPNVVILKNRDSSAHPWVVYHSSNTSAPETDYLVLNTTAATVDSGLIWNDTAPTSSVFTVGSATTPNGNGNKMIGYCFAEVEGFSKFGSYTGNGSTDGPFVYLGFRPAFVMIKRSNSTGNWLIHDSEREQDNPVNHTLYPNLSSAELGSGGLMDFVSNGFKKTYNDSDSNASGGTYIYMAFAENPFKQSLAR